MLFQPEAWFSLSKRVQELICLWLKPVFQAFDCRTRRWKYLSWWRMSFAVAGFPRPSGFHISLGLLNQMVTTLNLLQEGSHQDFVGTVLALARASSCMKQKVPTRANKSYLTFGSGPVLSWLEFDIHSITHNITKLDDILIFFYRITSYFCIELEPGFRMYLRLSLSLRATYKLFSPFPFWIPGLKEQWIARRW